MIRTVGILAVCATLNTLPFATNAEANEPGLSAARPIGSMSLIVQDSQRNGRKVPVQLWYPTDDAGSGPVAYIGEPALTPKAAELIAGEGDIQAAAKILANLMVPAVHQASVLDQAGGLPVVVFSTGTGMPRAFYTQLALSLAGSGYLVAVVDHPGVGLVALPEGVVERDAALTRPPPGLRDLSEEARDAFWTPRNELLAGDQIIVFNRLSVLNADRRSLLHGRLDMTRAAVGGHSSGFQSTACRVLPVVACINIEGVPILKDRRDGLDRPLLNIRDGADGPAQMAIYPRMRSASYDIVVTGSDHNSVSDLADLRGAPAVERPVILELTIAFLDRYLKRSDADPASVARDHPTVTVTRHGTGPDA